MSARTAKSTPSNMFLRMNLFDEKPPERSLKDEVLARLPMDLPFDVKTSMVNMIYRCVLQISYARDAIRTIRKLAPTAEDVVKDILDWIRRNPYLRRIHRAVYEMVEDGEKDRLYFARKWAVRPRDISAALRVLTPSDRRRIQKAAKTMTFAPPLCRESMRVMAEHVIRPYANQLVNRKVRFIAMYDPGRPLQDLEDDLVEEGLRATLHYDYMANETQLINYVKRCMHNHTVRIIKKATAKKRSRLVLVDDDARVYQTTTRSLDEMVGDGDEDRSLHEVIADSSESEDDRMSRSARELYSALKSMSPLVVFSVLLGKGEARCDGFDSYVEKNRLRFKEDDVVERTKAALAYHGLEWEAVRVNIRQALVKPTREQYMVRASA